MQPYQHYYIKTKALLAEEYLWESHLRRLLVLCTAVAFMMYVYCVAASILNVIARKEADAHAVSFAAAISSRESEYFSLTQSVKEESLDAHGLFAVTDKHFVTRTPTLGFSAHVR
ncbi:MAG: hypothetical protein KBE09_05335 [Candidatus Pacebacteria bacterium]|nr:hypothetical protein [Candidatus Paceibacterota bacterium]